MSILYALEGIRTDVLNHFFSAVTHLGDETIMILLLVFLYWCVNKKEALYLMFLTFLGTGLNSFLKLWFQVPRPWLLDPGFKIVESARAGASGFSFPSGHTQNAVCYMGALAQWSKRKWFKFTMLLGIILVAFSRMYLGVHTPVDVGVSLLIGFIMLVVLYPLFKNHGELVPLAFAILIVVQIILLLILESRPMPSDTSTALSVLKNAYMVLGGSIAMLISYYIDKKYINFDTKSLWWVNIIKMMFGLAFVMALRIVLKKPLEHLLNGNAIANAIRYFIVILFAGCIWPLSFKHLNKLGKKADVK